MNDPNLPTFSVIVPTYNRPTALSSCFAALAAMNYPLERFEVIAVDDGGTSDLMPLIERFGKTMNLKYVRQANAGPAAARNAGAAAAGHEFLAFIDDDCTPHASWLQEFATTLSIHPDALVGGYSVNGLPDSFYAIASHVIIDVVNLHFNRDHQHCTFFPSNNIAMSRGNFTEIGGFDPSFRCSEDRDLCDRWSTRDWQLIFATEAIVDHSRDMRLWGFCKQHFGYGRGAWRFHQARKMRESGKLQVEGSFYLKCFKRPFETQPLRRAIPLAMLMGVWQVANTAGFFFEAIKSSRHVRSRAVSAQI
jgi:glycosyltransferase involved in cell wall biosynthesis